MSSGAPDTNASFWVYLATFLVMAAGLFAAFALLHRTRPAGSQHAGSGEGRKSVKTQAHDEKTYFGFWVYLMTDLIMFAGLFAAFTVLRGNTAGGPGEKDVYHLPLALAETLILVVSSGVVGIAAYCATQGKQAATLALLSATGALGLAFLTLELHEFSDLVHSGNSLQRSGFLSGYFGLVGTHGLHITFGLLWLIVLGAFIIRRGLDHNLVRKVTLFSTFWHFLDIVWIFIFSVVYLTGTVL